jgi:hypothetical protein
MPDDTQQYQQPESAKWLTIIGSLLGGARGRPIGSTLMGLGGLADQKAQQAWQQAQWKQFLNTAKQKGVIDENHAALLEQVPPEAQAYYQQQLINSMIPQKPKEQGQQKVQMKDKAGNLVQGLYDPSTGSTQWLSEGETFGGEKGAQPKIPTALQASALAKHPGAVLEDLITHPDWLAEAARNAPSRRQSPEEIQANTTARLTAIDAFNAKKPFGSIVKDVVPYKVVNGKEVALPVTTPYGQVQNDPSVFYVPKPAVASGLYSRLNAIPAMGQSLVNATQKLLGSTPGGPAAYANRTFAQFMSKPDYARMQTALANYVDTVASSFSRRVSQSLIDNWKQSIAGRNASPASVAAAVKEISDTAERIKQGLKETGVGTLNTESGSSVSSELGELPEPMPTPSIIAPSDEGEDSEEF